MINMLVPFGRMSHFHHLTGLTRFLRFFFIIHFRSCHINSMVMKLMATSMNDSFFMFYQFIYISDTVTELEAEAERRKAGLQVLREEKADLDNKLKEVNTNLRQIKIIGICKLHS